MSLYGKVQRVDSSPFQFDRIYPNRVAMEAAQNSDKVFIGRYILIEYGERYQGTPGSTEVEETEEYVANKNADLNAYGDTFDSTVWIKVYSGSDEKYVMIAELNAFAPQLDLTSIGALLYKTATDASQTITVWDSEAKEPKQVQGIEELQVPEFDMMRSSEVSYNLNIPGPLKLNVGNENLNFGQDVNNIVYGAEPKDIGDQKNFAVWTPDNLNLPINNQVVESKTLRLSFESLGYAIKDLYDLLYGTPTGENGDWVRPFFKDGWTQANDSSTRQQYYKHPNKDSGNLNKDNDNLSWATGLNGMISGADKGLAGIIESLFASRNPLTGKVIYYLLNAWNLNYLDENQIEQPNISGKPEVITAASYQTRTIDGTTTREFMVDEGAMICQYGIDYSTWTLQGGVKPFIPESESESEEEEEQKAPVEPENNTTPGE